MMMWRKVVTLTVVLLANLSDLVNGKATETITIPGRTCSDHSKHETDAARLTSGSLTSRDGCVTLKADEDYFVIIYESMSLPCGQKLKLYYGASTVGRPDRMIDCMTPFHYLSTAFTPGKYLSVYFDAGTGSGRNNFSIVVTSFKKDFACFGNDEFDCLYRNQDICVDSDVQCDGVINCPDGRDEDEARCDVTSYVEGAQTLAVGIVVTIIVMSVLACIGCIVGIVCCCKRQRARQGQVLRPPATQTVAVAQPLGASAPAPYYPTGAQAPPPAAYQPPPGGYQPPPGGYQPPPGGYQQPAALPPGGYQPVPTAPPVGEPAYPPPSSYNPNYPPAADAQVPPMYPGHQPVQYSAQSADVKVPL